MTKKSSICRLLIWTAALAALVLIIGCNSPTDNTSKPVTKVHIVSSVDSISGAVGDTVVVKAHAEPDSLERPVLMSSNNAAVAAAVAETVFVLSGEGQTTLRLRWTDGVQEVIRIIPVTVAPSPWVTFRIRIGLIEGDTVDWSRLHASVAWRLPWKDSVTGPVHSDGYASFKVLREVAEVMDSVTVTVAGSSRHLSQSHNFLRKEVIFLPSWTKEMMFQATNSDFSSTGGDVYIDAVHAAFVVNPEFRFVLVPAMYAPPVGIGAGQAVTVSPVALYTPDRHSSRGWMSGIPFTNSNWVSWVDSLPIRLCATEKSFNPTVSDDSIVVDLTEADSIAFWGSVNDSLNARTGKVWFVPATTNCRAYWGVNPTLSGIYGQVNSKNGLPFVELKYFPSDTSENGKHVVRRTIPHELIHVLGFGHAGGWVSVMSTDGEKSPNVAPMDNAMLHLFYELGLAEKKMGGAVSVEATRQWLAMRGQWPFGWTLAKAAADAASVSQDTPAVSHWKCH